MYELPMIKTFDDQFACPVCMKTSNNEKVIERHMMKKSCHTIMTLCRDTIYEEQALKFCKDNTLCFSKMTLRKSKFYNTILNFIIFSNSIETCPLNLFRFLSIIWPSKNFIQKIARVDEATDVLAYRRWLQANGALIDSEIFYMQNEDALTDELFAVRSIIKGKITAEYLFTMAPHIINNMSGGLFLDLSDFLEGV